MQQTKKDQTVVAFERSIRNTQTRHKSPSKIKRLARRAAAREAGVTKPEFRKTFRSRPTLENLSNKQTLDVLTGYITLKAKRDAEARRAELSTMTKAEVMEEAKKVDLKGRSKMSKDELIKALS